jgi:hypothetical protein
MKYKDIRNRNKTKKYNKVFDSHDDDSESKNKRSEYSESYGSKNATTVRKRISSSDNYKNSKIKNSLCNPKMNFEECELVILRSAVDSAEELQGKKTANSPEVKHIISIVEAFLKRKRLICYGGTAINNILPKQDQFYNKEVEIPDYDFFSANALTDAKELTDIYVKAGFEEAEAKSGQHHGTFKVFVNFIPVADITSIPAELFNKLKQDAKHVGGILYAPPNYLRMSMYLELSRPSGDVSRWEKVLKRLSILNKHYPLSAHNCDHVEFQRKMSNKVSDDKIFETVKKTLIDQGAVFFGGYAVALISQYMPANLKKQLEKNPDFDVLSEDPVMTADIVKERLDEMGIKNVTINRIEGIGEVIAPHYEIKIGKDNVAVIYEPLACHSYNTIRQHGDELNIATIDTMLSFYLAFLYIDNPLYNYNPERILCMSQFLFDVQQKNRLNQKGLLKRFSLNCMGHQPTIEEMREEKAKMFKTLSGKKGTKEYDEWFLRYKPSEQKDQAKNRNGNKKTLKNSNKGEKRTRRSMKNKTRKKKGLLSIFK